MRSLLIFVILLFWQFSVQAQEDTLELKYFFLGDLSYYQAGINNPSPSISLVSPPETDMIKKGLYLPFFCRMESKWEEKAGRPLKFRLGSVEIVDRYEGKSGPVFR
ncbi:MAG: hypothetical protein R3275_10195 [Saprospiraceae bacterium]|nr:hypothetical protein [Saprospiraceae bacterium]